MDLAKVAAKAIHNLQGVKNTNQFWSEEAVKKLDDFTLNFGEELDSIMVSANRRVITFSAHVAKANFLKPGCGDRRGARADLRAARLIKSACQRHARGHQGLPNRQLRP